jgi:hypothetical protein
MVLINKKLFGLIVALAVLAPAAVQAKELAAIITRIVGYLYVAGPGDRAYRPAKKGEFIYEGTTMKTGKGDRAAISFVNGTVVKINHSTTYAIKPTHPSRRGQGSDTQLKSGKMWFKVMRKGSKFQVKTPLATAAVRGTEGDVSVGDNFSATCYEGSFRVAAQGPGEEDPAAAGPGDNDGVIVSAGQICTVQEGQAPDVAPIKTKDNWFNEIAGDEKGALKFSADKTEVELDAPVKVKVKAVKKDGRADTELAASLRLYADKTNVAFSRDARSWGDAHTVSLAQGEGEFWVKAVEPGYFNVSTQLDGYEVMPARVNVSRPLERDLDVYLETDKGKREKIRLKFKR